MQMGVLEGMICSGTWLASKLLWLLGAAALVAEMFFFQVAIREVNHAQPHAE